jgi:adenosine deaminase CECR1
MNSFRNLLFSFLLISLLNLAAPGKAADFESRFQEIVQNATNEQLYRFLYALPKGGDLHNHQDGANWPDWWYQVATDPTKTHGDTFYTLTEIASSNPSGAAPLFFTTIPKWQYDRLPDAEKAQYQALSSLDAATKANWLASLWLGQPGDGREKFFEQIWPRLGGLVRNPYVSSELLVESMKHFGEEGVRYIETQNLVFGLGSLFEYKDQDGIRSHWIKWQIFIVTGCNSRTL